MATIFYERDANPNALKGRTIAVLGYGSQGHAQAQNLRDSGYKVIVGLDPDRLSAQQARADGMVVVAPAEAAKRADWIQILTPDETQSALYESAIEPYLHPGKTLGVSHGFSIHFKTIQPPNDVDVVMIAPKSPGHLLRRVYSEGRGVPSLLARADLADQERIRDPGRSRLPAGSCHLECLHEMKLIVDLIYEGGLGRMRYSISNTAEYGDLTPGNQVVGDETRARMKEIIARIRDGSFAREWIQENKQGGKNFVALREKEKKHAIEEVGAKLRAMMSWLPNESKKAQPAQRPQPRGVNA